MNKMMSTAGSARNGELNPDFATHPLDVLDAAYHTAHEYPGGIPPLAFRMGVPASTLNHKVNLSNSTHHLTLKEAVLMQAVSGNFAILHAMAGALGHVVLQVDAETDAQPMTEVARMVSEFSELLSRVTKSTADGSVTMNEVRECQRQAMAAIGAIYGVMASVRGLLPESRA